MPRVATGNGPNTLGAEGYGRPMAFGVLGPGEHRRDSSANASGGPKQRGERAMLARSAVSTDRPITDTRAEGGGPLGSAIAPHVHRRSAVGARRPDRVDRRQQPLEAEPPVIDARAFEQLVAEARFSSSNATASAIDLRHSKSPPLTGGAT